MKIICIDGCHGAGKTTLLEQSNLDFLNEGFLSEYELHEKLEIADPHEEEEEEKECDPQSFENEQKWVRKWFRRVQSHKQSTVLCDRSPLAACAYVTSDSELLEKQVLQKMKSLSNHEFHILVLDIDFDVVMKQIHQRLLQEPFREAYHEDDPIYTREKWNYFHHLDRLHQYSQNVHIHMFQDAKSLLDFYMNQA